MEPSFALILNSLLLGVGLAMDAFSVSLADGLAEPCMKFRKMCAVSGVFAAFQAAMPLTGWFCVHTFVQYFRSFQRFIPFIALGLLAFIGGKMIYETLRPEAECDACKKLTFTALVVQGVATSIDALSVGFTIASYDAAAAILSAAVIAAVTFVICLVGIFIGRRAGTAMAGKAGLLGGVILILVGLEIFITSFL